MAPSAASNSSSRKAIGYDDAGGSLDMTFDQYEKERLVSVLGRVQLRMDFIETTMQDMLHKIKLMMIRD